MKFAFVFVVASAIALCSGARVGTMELVRSVNAKTNLWTASLSSPVAHLTHDEFRSLLGAGPEGFPKLAGRIPHKNYSYMERSNAPEQYDPRDHYDCASMRMVRDQSACGSCWAVAAAATISDRACIANGHDVIVSATDVLACSDGGGCDGGDPASALMYWRDDGVVTDECSPYPFPSCDHHIPGSKNPCPKEDYPTPACKRICSNGKKWKDDKHYAREIYYLDSVDDIVTELATNGPCETSFAVYEDFTVYTSGIYHHVSGGLMGYHAVKMMGYGVENGVKYWLITNNWNDHWGEKGLFRILRGRDECGIESEVLSGIAKKE